MMVFFAYSTNMKKKNHCNCVEETTLIYPTLDGNMLTSQVIEIFIQCLLFSYDCIYK